MPVDDDLALCQRLAAEAGLSEPPHFTDPVVAKSFISGCDVLVGSRMHACIAASSSGVATIPVAYSRKFAGLFESIGYRHTIDAREVETDSAVEGVLSLYEEREALARDAAAASAAALAGDARIEARATLGLAELGLNLDPEATMASTQQAVDDILATLERLGDDEGLASAWRLTGNFLSWQGRNADAEAVWARAFEYASRAGDAIPRGDLLLWPAWTAWYGPLPVEAGLRRCQELVERADGDRQVEAIAIIVAGILRGMQGEFEEARAAIAEGRAILEQLGSLHWTGTGMTAADLELMAGDAHAAEELARPAYEQLREHSTTGDVASALGFLAQAVVAQGRDEEALRLADEVAGISAGDDFDPHARHRLVRAIVLARRGEHERGRQEARDALALVEPTDCLLLRIQVVFALAEVERAAGDRNAEAAALEEVVRLAELKGDLVAGEQARTRLDTLGAAPARVVPSPLQG